MPAMAWLENERGNSGNGKNEESMSFRESRGVDFSRGLVETVDGRWSSTAA
jgi:hypothetical protein